VFVRAGLFGCILAGLPAFKVRNFFRTLNALPAAQLLILLPLRGKERFPPVVLSVA
jgi:hypothetical protein